MTRFGYITAVGAVTQSGGEITWKNDTFPNEWIDKDKKIKFYIKNADIYSYLPENINQDIDNGWPDY